MSSWSPDYDRLSIEINHKASITVHSHVDKSIKNFLKNPYKVQVELKESVINLRLIVS